MTLGSVSFLGVLYLLALFFQDALGLNALHAGLSIFPEALGVMTGAQLVTRFVYPALGPRRVMVVGLLVIAGAMSLLIAGGRGDQPVAGPASRVHPRGWDVRGVPALPGCRVRHDPRDQDR